MENNIPEPLKEYGKQVLNWVIIAVIFVVVAQFGLQDSVQVEVPQFPQPPIEVFISPLVAQPEPESDTGVTYGYQTNVYMDDGGDKMVVASGGEAEVQSGGTLDLQTGSTNTFAGTIDFSGATVTNLSMSGGTVAGALLVDGAADAVQLTVQGWTTQTSNLVVFENSLGVDMVTVSGAGAAMLTSTLDVRGSVSDGAGTLTIADDALIDGAADAVQLTVQGWTTQTSDIFVVENSAGTNRFVVDNSGNTAITGTLGVTGAVTLQGAFYSSFANLTVSDGDTVTPTYTTYALDSAGSVTITLAATGTEGQLLVLIGDDANDITINDTNVRTNDGGVQVINQYDIVMWVYQDAEWIELSESSNS